MRAVRFYGPGDLRVDSIPEPAVGPKQVKIKIAWTGICGTDLHTYHGFVPGGREPAEGKDHQQEKAPQPFVFGHEISGTIVELGSEVDTTRLAVGQNIAIDPILTCMRSDCLDCATPSTRNLCSVKWAFIGGSGDCGGMAEYAAVDEYLVHVLPSNVSLEVGAMMEPLAVAWHAIKKANFKHGQTALVLGAGPVGILLVKALRSTRFQAGWVGVSARSSQRGDVARQFGASAVFVVSDSDSDVAAETLATTKGRGVDAVFDCAGSQSTLDTAIKAVRHGGIIVNLAFWVKAPTVDMNVLLMKEVALANSLVYADDHPEMLQAVGRGEFSGIEKMITRRVPMEDVVEKGIKALIHEKHQHIKILVHP